MGPIRIFFGTESGNSEMVADDIAAVLSDHGIDSEIEPLDEVDVPSLVEVTIAVFITSTYGEGELPMTTAPFHEQLVTERPDLGSLQFAAFGLGDKTYDTYNNAISVLADSLVELGAAQIGATGRHDASGPEDYSEVATAWATELLETALMSSTGQS